MKKLSKLIFFKSLHTLSKTAKKNPSKRYAKNSDRVFFVGFSRDGGADFQKKYEKFFRPFFFRSSKNSELSQSCKKTLKFLVTDPKIFLKAPLAPIYTNFERDTRAKKKFPKIA